MKDRRREDEELAEEDAGAEDGKPALALSDEIAERWDPRQLLRMVSSQAGRGEPLDEVTRRRYESRFGADLGDVRIFRGQFAEEVTKAHSAEAITVGGTGMILMGNTAARSPVTRAGGALLTHELTHAAQDSRGLHRRAYDGATPLATSESESEAEAAEAEDLGGAPGAPGPDPDADKKREEKIAKLFARLVEVFEEDERLFEERNGLPRYRT
jgi:hypothetical protein